MVFAKEKIQVGILVRIPFRPAMIPIRPPAIAGEFVEDTDGASLAGPRLRVEDKLCAAVRACGYGVGCLVHGALRLQFHLSHTLSVISSYCVQVILYGSNGSGAIPAR